MNKYAFGRLDREIEHSRETAAAEHAIGRITCSPARKTKSESHSKYIWGFFHKLSSSIDLEAKYGNLY